MKAEILDGKRVARGILRDVKQRAKGKSLKLAVVQVGENPVSQTYVAEKQKVGAEAGIEVQIFRFPAAVTQQELEREVERLGKDKNITGLIVQLPLPTHIHREEMLDRIPLEKDVDMLSSAALQRFEEGSLSIVPPTVGAVQALFSVYGIDIRDKKIALVGQGKLVGMPLRIWLEHAGAEFQVADKETKDLAAITRTAGMVISGVGKANLITGDMIRQGAVVIDAGTSVEGGKTAGDVDFASVVQKASYISPVPGGVGPVTVACLFQNLISLSKNS